MVYEFKLETSENGLIFFWHQQKYEENKKLSLCLSEYATCGSIFPVDVPYSLYIQMFYPSEKINFYKCCIVACNSDEVFLVDLNAPGMFQSLCISTGQITWVNILHIAEEFVIVFLKRSGELNYGMLKPSGNKKLDDVNDLFTWKSTFLSMTCLSCVNIDDVLVITNGHSSIMCKISLDSSGLKIKEIPLSIMGSVELASRNSKIIFKICDGREYEKTLLELKILSEDAVPLDTHLNLQNINLYDALQTSKRVNNEINIENIKLNKVDEYIDQLSLVHCLLTEKCRKSLFIIKFDASPSLEKEDSFVLTIELTMNSDVFKLKGVHWQLNVKLKGLNKLYNNLSPLFTDNRFIINLHLPNLILKELCDCKDIAIHFMLLFTHFSSSIPLCCVYTQQEALDTIIFLKQKRQRSWDFPIKPSFENMIVEYKSFTCDINKESRLSNKTFLQKITVLTKHFPVILSLFSLKKKESTSFTLWFCNLSVLFIITVNQEDILHFNIMLQGASDHLLKVLKRDVEKHILKAFNDQSSVKLGSELLRKAHVMSVAIGAESNRSSKVLAKLCQDVLDLVSSVPI